MSLYAISDLHLSGAQPKPMDIFGNDWTKHKEKIEINWLQTIKDEDMVLIPGDISWAMKTEEALIDLDFIDTLPGKKVFVKGNHDYWWNSVSKLNAQYETMVFLQNDFTVYKDTAICGSRGWDLPSDKSIDSDLKTYQRELRRIKLSLNSAVKKGFNQIVFMMHFPPLLVGHDESAFINIFEEYGVQQVIYGHLHGKENFKYGFQGMKNNCRYTLVSADYLAFQPVKILD